MPDPPPSVADAPEPVDQGTENGSGATSAMLSSGTHWPDVALPVTAGVLVLAYAVHGMDHLRRGLHEEPTAVLVVGAAQSLLLALAVVLVITKSRWAPGAAIVVGSANAFGFIVQHLLPDWFGPFGDSFVAAPPEHHIIGFSWFAVVFDILAAATFAAAGLAALRSGAAGRPVIATRGGHPDDG